MRLIPEVQDQNLAKVSKHKGGERYHDVDLATSLQLMQIWLHLIVKRISQLFIARVMGSSWTIWGYYSAQEFDTWEGITFVALWEQWDMS